MKKLSVLLFWLAAFLISCQIKAENSLTNSSNTNFAENIAKIEDSKILISPIPTSKKTFNIHSKIGIVDVFRDEPSCLRTKNSGLAEKTPVSIIFSLDEFPQKVITAIVDKKLSQSCARRASETGDENPGESHFYTLGLIGKLPQEFFGFDVGIAVIEPSKPIQVQNNLASFDLNEDGKPEFFRSCGGFEGTHFTIWTGKPLKGKRIWHSFYYVDYDTVPTCKKKEWDETEN